MERETGIEPATNGLEGRALCSGNRPVFRELAGAVQDSENLIGNLQAIVCGAHSPVAAGKSPLNGGFRWTRRVVRPDSTASSGCHHLAITARLVEKPIRNQQVSGSSPLVGSSQSGSVARPVHIDQLLNLWRTVGPCLYGDSGHGV